MYNIKRGIVCMGIGHPIYANWAYNLAVSIHDKDPDMPVVLLISDQDGLRSDRQVPDISEFWDVIVMDRKDYIGNYNALDPMKAKTRLYDYSPFEETLFLDVDLIMLPGSNTVDKIFEIHKDVNFGMSCRGASEIRSTGKGWHHWIRQDELPEEILKKHFPDVDTSRKLYNLSSETIFFRKCREQALYWDMVKKMYAEPKINYRLFGGNMPDELAHELAMVMTDVKPKFDIWEPHFWASYHRKRMRPTDMYVDFFGYSMGGGTVTEEMTRFYNGLCMMYLGKRGRKNYWPGISKKKYSPERGQL